MFMITSQGWLNPTRAAGLAAYGTACTCCGIAWIKTKAGRSSQLAALLALIESVFLLDIAFSWRWMLHDVFAGFAQRHEIWGSKIATRDCRLHPRRNLAVRVARRLAVLSREGRRSSGGLGGVAVANCVVYRGGISPCRGLRLILFIGRGDGSKSSVDTVMHHDFDRNLARTAINPIPGAWSSDSLTSRWQLVLKKHPSSNLM